MREIKSTFTEKPKNYFVRFHAYVSPLFKFKPEEDKFYIEYYVMRKKESKLECKYKSSYLFSFFFFRILTLAYFRIDKKRCIITGSIDIPNDIHWFEYNYMLKTHAGNKVEYCNNNTRRFLRNDNRKRIIQIEPFYVSSTIYFVIFLIFRLRRDISIRRHYIAT